MAWNPSPEVAVARDAANRLNADRCIVIWTTAAGQIGMASFGQTKALCANAGKLGDVAYEAVVERLKEGGGVMESELRAAAERLRQDVAKEKGGAA